MEDLDNCLNTIDFIKVQSINLIPPKKLCWLQFIKFMKLNETTILTDRQLPGKLKSSAI